MSRRQKVLLRNPCRRLTRSGTKSLAVTVGCAIHCAANARSHTEKHCTHSALSEMRSAKGRKRSRPSHAGSCSMK